ncbi:antitoxin [Tessaracoccus flavus]|jgi:hypothetical protein|uniref:Uncharacterized protein n=1 Tax=Tessaracoccus flavus TaxID=1610493 RepID=A0A1Q2CER9_9ACTN|nr:hypothetical protein RPIT_07060 [Tessaracoccus flavus]SDZ08655.1 MT0933-like antitoxin protein [Tessaracoccus flavus]
MGLFDKARDLAAQHEDKIEDGIERGGDFVDDKTGGKYAGQVDQAQDFANNHLDEISGSDNVPPTTPVPGS